MFGIKMNRVFMLLATLAIVFNLFSGSFSTINVKSKSSFSETSFKNFKKSTSSEQSMIEECDFSETEENCEEDQTDVHDLLFADVDFYESLFKTNEHHYIASSSPFLKPLRSEDTPLFLLLQNIRL
jgi:hypothetical protein